MQGCYSEGGAQPSLPNRGPLLESLCESETETLVMSHPTRDVGALDEEPMSSASKGGCARHDKEGDRVLLC